MPKELKLKLMLPYPPSVNHYWRWYKGRMILTARAKVYRDEVILRCRQQGCYPEGILKGLIDVQIRLIMPDARKRDIDNILKSILDALQHARVYEDDNQIDQLSIQRGPIEPPGKLIVTIRTIEQQE